MTGRDARKLAIAILGDEPGAHRKAKEMAGAYLDLMRAADIYFRQSLPYEGDEDAQAANARLLALLPTEPQVIA